MLENYLSYSLHIIVPVYTESFNRNSFAVVGAFPNIAEAPLGNWVFGRLDEFVRYGMGIRKQSRSTTQLSEFLK